DTKTRRRTKKPTISTLLRVFVFSWLHRCERRRLRTLHRQRDAVAASETERRYPALQIASLQRVEERRQHAPAARADRVPERHGAAVDVDLRGIDLQLVQDGNRLHGKRFVQLEEVDVFELPANLFRDTPNR